MKTIQRAESVSMDGYGWFHIEGDKYLRSGFYMTGRGCCIFYQSSGEAPATDLYFCFRGRRYSRSFNKNLSAHALKLACTRLMGDVISGRFKAIQS